MPQSLRSILLTCSAALASALVLSCVPSVSFADSATYAYDTRGRVSSITYDDGTVVEYAYDASGNRIGATRTNPPPDTEPPSAPGAPTFTNVTMTSATANWTAASDNREVVGYEYRLNAGSWQSTISTAANLTGLTPATTYTVQVRARDAASNLSAASSNSFTTPDSAAPTVPTNLAASASGATSVNLSWSASTDNVAVAGYHIFRNSAQVATATTTSYSNTSLSTGATYSYQVRAFDAAGNVSALSSTSNVTLAPPAPPSISVPATSTTGAYTISWQSASGATGYELYQATNSGFSGQVLAYAGAALSIQLSGRGNGVYYYRVRACNAGGCGGYLVGANAITVALPPEAPGSITAPSSSTTGAYTVSWSSANGSPTSYELYESTNSGFSSQSLVYSGAGLSAQISGRSNGTYYYRVRACNASGCSAYRSGASAVVQLAIQVLNPSVGVPHNNVYTGISTLANLNGNPATIHSLTLNSCPPGTGQIQSGAQSIRWFNSNYYYHQCESGWDIECSATYVIRNSNNGQLHTGTSSVVISAQPMDLAPGQECN